MELIGTYYWNVLLERTTVTQKCHKSVTKVSQRGFLYHFFTF
nr:MAG TPA: hypothetical protein [Caudoviricetes sp.]